MTLPKALFLDQSHIGKICTRVQFAAERLPGALGLRLRAEATTPLLDEPLKGPVYLGSSDNELPDLLADLHGQVDVQLRGVINATKARMKTVFDPVPDVPVSKFVAHDERRQEEACWSTRATSAAASNFSILNFKAQNGKKLKKKKLRLRTPCKKRQEEEAARRQRLAINGTARAG